MKFSQMPYERVELADAQEKIADLLARFEGAKTADEMFGVYKEYDDYNAYVSTMIAISYIRNTMNTGDEFYEAEVAHFNKIRPQLMEGLQAFTKAMLNHPFRKDMEEAWGSLMFVNAEMQLKTFAPEIIEDLQEENKLSTEYQKLVASAEIEFDGKTMNLAELRAYGEDLDREKRKAASIAVGQWFNGHAARLDEIFDQLVKLRHSIGQKLGHDKFTQVGYYRMGRNCYDAAAVDKFRQGVVEHIVPLAHELRKAQAKRIGLENDFKFYDNELYYPDGNAKPQGTPEEIFAHGKKLYEELSPETAEFMNAMLDGEMFDVLTRPKKAMGGYCYGLALHKIAFVFANFNGTSGDIDVLTHEAGHAYAGYMARDIYPSALRSYSNDTAEVHSMAMEFLTWPWMEGFFGEQTEKYYNIHLAGALTFIPYGTMVDEFQHHIYEKPEMTPVQRNELWNELEKKYRPWVDVEDLPFYSEGRRWQMQMHIYQRPFYYIDYCLAQMTALAFWGEAQEDFKAAWKKYHHLVTLAGTKTFLELVELSGMPSPFVPENLKIVSQAASKWLNSR